MSVDSPAVYKDGYMGGLSYEQCDKILSIKEKECTPELENSIFVFPYDLIIRSIEERKSIRQIIKDEKIDYTQYIAKLRPYQTVGAEFLINSHRAMIGDGVGLGKTAEIAATINVLKQTGQLTRFIMAVETTAFMQTQAELIKFTGLRIVALPSDSTKLKKVLATTDWSTVDGIVIKHCTIKNNPLNVWFAKHLDLNTRKSTMFNMFILDESSVIKNKDTQLCQYCINISNMVDRTYMMNATSFEKHIMDIYYQFDILDSKLLPNESFIKKNFCTMSRKSFWRTERPPGQGAGYKRVQKFAYELAGYKNQQIFKDSLKFVYFGRSFKEVNMAVDHIYKVYTVQPNPTQTSLISAGFHTNEVLNCPSLLDPTALQMRDYKPLPFDRKNNPKLDRLCDLAEHELDGMSFMVYCWHVQAQYQIKAELEKLGRRVTIINGEDPKGKDADMIKLDRIQRFNSGEFDVIVTNIQKSLNLHGADAMILYSSTATVGRLEQIRGRIDRHVDDKIRTYIMLLYEGTSEYELMTKTARMRGQASKELILDSETAIDYFMHSIDEA